MRTSNSTDVYTLWKQNEELHQSPLTIIPFKTDTTKFLVPTFSQVLYTDGYTSIKEDDEYEKTLFDEEMEIPCIGSEKKHFDQAEMITFDIPGSSTRLPLMCKMIIYQQGATHEREPPILVRDVCIQSDGNHQFSSNEKPLQRTRSNDLLFDSANSNQYSSMTSSTTEDDETGSIVTVGENTRHRISHLLHRHKYLRQIDKNFLSQSEFYSTPFYQYRGRRYGQKHVQIQVKPSDLLHSTSYSVTLIFPIRNRHPSVTNSSELFDISIPVNDQSKHTTIGYIHTKEYVRIQRTFGSHVTVV